MTVEISGPPTPVENPAFAGMTVSVPLSETPTKVWLDLLALQDLPGKGHRLRGAALEFHLDRGSHDVSAAMRKIGAAISKATLTYAEHGQQLEVGATNAQQRHASSREKISRQLEAWWSEQQKNGDTASELPPTSTGTKDVESA